MGRLGPLTVAPLRRKLESLGDALDNSQKQPWIGVTQGGSSSKDSGARVAAVDANAQRKRPANKE